jgi:hypothetical protein
VLKIFASSFPTQNIWFFVEIQFHSEVILKLLPPCSIEKKCQNGILYFCLNLKLSESNRLIVLHKSAQNECYFIVSRTFEELAKSGHGKVAITGTCYSHVALPSCSLNGAVVTSNPIANSKVLVLEKET